MSYFPPPLSPSAKMFMPVRGWTGQPRPVFKDALTEYIYDQLAAADGRTSKEDLAIKLAKDLNDYIAQRTSSAFDAR